MLFNHIGFLRGWFGPLHWQLKSNVRESSTDTLLTYMPRKGEGGEGGRKKEGETEEERKEEAQKTKKMMMMKECNDMMMKVNSKNLTEPILTKVQRSQHTPFASR